MSYLSRLHKLLINHFNMEELELLCFDLNVETDDLPSNGRANKAMDLVKQMARQDKLPFLLETLQRHRPQVSWPAIPPDFKYAPQPVFHQQTIQKHRVWLISLIGVLVVLIIGAIILSFRSQLEKDPPELPLFADTKSTPLNLSIEQTESAFEGKLFLHLVDIYREQNSVDIRVKSPGYDEQEVRLADILASYRYSSDSIFEITLYNLSPDDVGNSAVFIVSEITEKEDIDTLRDLNAAQLNSYIIMDYTVQEGDTLTAISENLLTNEDVLALSGIDNEDLVPGQVIKIPVVDPASCGPFGSYIVRSGDSIYAIAYRFGTTVEAILATNPTIVNINLLYTGMILCIPT